MESEETIDGVVPILLATFLICMSKTVYVLGPHVCNIEGGGNSSFQTYFNNAVAHSYVVFRLQLQVSLNSIY